ncbi:MAG TPA: amidase [Acidimicrobiales bacterium]|nr:amidase [Acidimicrobiales bacterium]
MADDLGWTDAVAQAELVRSKQCSPLELVDAAIARIERLDPYLNAVIHRMYEKARDAAAANDLPNGPFRGVPFLMKDAVAHTAGDPFHCGMAFLKARGHMEDTDSYFAAKLRAAGFVFVGKTNLPELAASFLTEPVAYGPTHNPWDLARSTGGSSGGSAAAVASGMVPAAHANDMGGSIRVPASACGLVGLKPSRARTSLGPRFGEYWAMLTHEHVVTRTVRDCAAILDCTAGAMPGDPYTAPPPSRAFADEVGEDPGRLRIGWRTNKPGGDAPDADCVAAVERTVAVLASLGHEVEPAAFPELDIFPPIALGVFATAIARDLDRWGERYGVTITEADVEPRTWLAATVGRSVASPDYISLVETAQGWARQAAHWWAEGNDILVTPTMPVIPPELGSGDLIDLGPFTMPWNFAGQPAISLPLHMSESGLPVGVQLVAAYGREDLLLRVAAQLEQVLPWADRRPPISA